MLKLRVGLGEMSLEEGWPSIELDPLKSHCPPMRTHRTMNLISDLEAINS